MAQVTLIQYAEIVQGTNPPIIIGNKVKPSTISLTGTGEIFHRVWNDASTWPLVMYSAELTEPVKFIAIKSSIDGQLCLASGAGSGTNSAIPVEAGIWTILSGGDLATYAADEETRAGGPRIYVDTMVFDPRSVSSADIELLVAY